jgi:hypothetical protein
MTDDEKKSCKLVKAWKGIKNDILDADQERAETSGLGFEDDDEIPDPESEADVVAVIDAIIEELDGYISGRFSYEVGGDVDDEDTRFHRRRVIELIRMLRMR